MAPDRARVAVIGLGISGLCALKNLIEVGLDAVAFERNEDLGGLWRINSDVTQTSVLASTVTNVSRQRSCYTDFPFPDDKPDFPTAQQTWQYLHDYADHFQLRPYMRFKHNVHKVERDPDGQHWTVTVTEDHAQSRKERFDKVLLVNGTYARTWTPSIPGVEQYTGRILHAQAYKGPADFNGQRVMVVGLSNTGSDIVMELLENCKRVYGCHNGIRLLTRYDSTGKPSDHIATRKFSIVSNLIANYLPTQRLNPATMILESRMKKDPRYREEWGLLPAAPMSHVIPIINDHIMDVLAKDRLTSVRGLKRFAGGKTVEADDGTTYDVDAVILCTGYRFDYSVLDPDVDPTGYPTPEWDASPNKNGLQYARLYQGLFSSQFPDSLALIGAYRGFRPSVYVNVDLATQAVAQVWAGNYPLPPRDEIQRWCDHHYRWSVDNLKVHRLHMLTLPPGELEVYLNAAIGNGVSEKLGWGWQGWLFWYQNRELYKLLLNGIDTPYLYRLFDGRRPKWEGAEAAIYRTNGKMLPP